MNALDLKGRIAAITGGARGIGLAVAERIAASGGRPAIWDVDLAEAEKVAARLGGFAAKEAASKALGTGFAQGVFMRDLGVVNLRSGKPTLQLTGGAAARLAALTPPGHTAQVDLTMTDEYPYASAIVIISAVRLAG